MLPVIDQKKVAEKYNHIEQIWNQDDKWHYKTNREISKFLRNISDKYKFHESCEIANIGSGGNAYCFDEARMLHIDIAKAKILNKKRFLEANVEKLPLVNECFDLVLCVGSVLNYCNVDEAISEISRITKPGGFLVLEYENSKSFEYIKTQHYCKSCTCVETFYNNNFEKLYVYSESHIDSLLIRKNWITLQKKRFHIISPLIYKLTKQANFAQRLMSLDWFFRKIPILKNNSANIIMFLQKQ